MKYKEPSHGFATVPPPPPLPLQPPLLLPPPLEPSPLEPSAKRTWCGAKRNGRSKCLAASRNAAGSKNDKSFAWTTTTRGRGHEPTSA
jgi:hypothetical protein